MSEDKRGPFRLRDRRTVYKNPWLHVREDQVMHERTGQDGIFGVVEMRAGSTVLAMDRDRDVYLVREYKYALDDESLELVSGGLDAGESPLEAAQRELSEELGITSDNWIDLGLVHPFTNLILSPNYLFAALEVVKTQEPQPDPLEAPKLVKLPFSQVLDTVLEGGITHSASCTCILKAAQRLRLRDRID